MQPFNSFDCKMKWRLYDSNNAQDTDCSFDPLFGYYLVRQEYDLRMYCTWANRS